MTRDNTSYRNRVNASGAAALPADFKWSALVPELLVANLQRSLEFWTHLLGFNIVYERGADKFAYLVLGEAQVMLEEVSKDRWITAPLQTPFGRGINFQIKVAELAPIMERLTQAKWPLYRGIEEHWYQAGQIETGLRQFLVQDPDGYLVRLVKPLGTCTVRLR